MGLICPWGTPPQLRSLGEFLSRGMRIGIDAQSMGIGFILGEGRNGNTISVRIKDTSRDAIAKLWGQPIPISLFG